MNDKLLTPVAYKPIKKIKIGTVNGNWGDWTGSVTKDFDVKSILPDIYDKLTVDNFIIEPKRMTLRLYSVGEIDNTANWNCGEHIYDPNTGILKIGQIYVYTDKAGIGYSFAGVDQRDVYCIY